MPKTTGSLEPMKGRCASQLTFTGTGPENPVRYCMTWPMSGKRRCRRHGGKNEHGLSHPAWKHGYAMKGGIPRRIVDNFERLLKDDQLTSLKREIAWQRAYYEDLQQRAEDGNVVAPAMFKAITNVLDAWLDFKQAAKPGTQPQARQAASNALSKAMGQLTDSRSPAITEAAVRSELRSMFTVLANLTDKESRQYERLYNMITAERAMALRVAEHTLFIEAMERYVSDPATKVQIRKHVASGFEQLAGGRDHTKVVAERGAIDVRPSDSTPDD